MKTIKIFEKAGAFAENKDVAKDIRQKEIVPALNENKEVILDFKNVHSATQSFIHALISDILRKYGIDVLDRISFKSCSETIKQIIGIVIDYMQEGMGIETNSQDVQKSIHDISQSLSTKGRLTKASLKERESERKKDK